MELWTAKFGGILICMPLWPLRGIPGGRQYGSYSAARVEKLGRECVFYLDLKVLLLKEMR